MRTSIPAKKATKSKASRNLPRTPEATEVGRNIAILALAWVRQEGNLRVRQREQLRRAFYAAAEFLSWSALLDNPFDIAIKDVAKLTKSGTQTITRELAEETADKKTEIERLRESAEALEKLAEEGDFSDPIEVDYAHTARRAPEDLITKIITLTLTEPQEARDAAAVILRKIESWNKLRDQMLEELKRRQERITEMTKSHVAFVESSKGLVSEVFATLH